MIAYLIKGATRKGLAVYTYSNIASATRAAETRFTDYPTTVAAEESDLSRHSGPALVSLYNNLIGEGETPVNKFTTRSDGARRVFTLLVEMYAQQPVESEADSVVPETETTTNEDDMKGKTKPKKAKKEPKAKKVRVKKERVAKAPKDRHYKASVVSKGSEKAKGTALEMIQRANGATADEIKDRLGVSLGTAKNLVWYLRRDNYKIVVDRTKERKPYVIAD